MAQWPIFNRSGLSSYNIGPLIAHGGMSCVHKATRIRDNAVVAIKLITPEFSAMAEELDRIFQKDSEGQIAASLRHKNVVRTYEYGKKGKEYYIVMEYIDGPNLKRLIDSGEPSWRDNRYSIGLSVAHGLAYIHRSNLVHRDFCPKNILLTQDNSPKIIDFGLALPANTKQKGFDRSGTASYMAPEQVRGKEVDRRADIYAFGMTLYEALTGRRPYPETKSRQKKMAGHLNIDPTPPRSHEKDIPIPLEHIIMRCIAKNPAHRYSTMEDVIQEMTHVYGIFLSRTG